MQGTFVAKRSRLKDCPRGYTSLPRAYFNVTWDILCHPEITRWGFLPIPQVYCREAHIPLAWTGRSVGSS